MLSAIASGAFVAAFVLGLAGAVRFGRARRRAVARGRFGEVVDAGALAKHEGELVTVRGRLEGGELSTRFRPGLEAIDEPHPEAESTGDEQLYVACGTEKVPILGAAQVVVGAREEQSRELRRARAGQEVLARGIVARLEDGAYREGKARFALAARPDGAWAARPVALAVFERDRSALALTIVALACACAGGAIAMEPTPLPTLPRMVTTCGDRIIAKLDRNDVFGAEADLPGCNDARARAETLWSLGRIDEAAGAFREARAASPSTPVTLSEAEALLVAQPSDVQLLARMRQDWYRGPADPSQRALECVGI
jgi:hypothetical protein